MLHECDCGRRSNSAKVGAMGSPLLRSDVPPAETHGHARDTARTCCEGHPLAWGRVVASSRRRCTYALRTNQTGCRWALPGEAARNLHNIYIETHRHI